MFGRLIFGLIPWWMFAGFAVAITPVTTRIAMEQYELVRAQEAALDVPAPRSVPLHTFDPAQLSEPFLEFAVTGVFEGVTGHLHSQKLDHYFALVEAPQAGGAAIALYTPAYASQILLDDLEAARQDDGEVLVRGFLIEGLYKTKIRDNLAAQGITLTGPLYVADAYFGTRDEGLAGQARDARGLMVVSAFFSAAFWLAALAKYWAWRMRRKANAPRIPSRKRRKKLAGAVSKSAKARTAKAGGKAAVKTPLVKSSDGYDDGPIKSKKGLFR